MRPLFLRSLSVFGVFFVAIASPLPVKAGPVLFLPGFDDNNLPANDDGSTGSIALPFTLDFFGSIVSNVFINNNGNITFDSPLSSFTPFDLTTTARQIIAPFFADVDTRGIGAVTYGSDTVGGNDAFGVTWKEVGFYNQNTSPTNTFQVILVDRSDTGAGNFDIVFNYDQILWETGTASGGSSSGLGGSSARAGFSNGTGSPGTFYEFPGSAVNGAFLDYGPAATSLVLNNLDTVPGRYIFGSRNGVITPTPVPEPQTLALFGFGLAALFGIACRRRSKPSALLAS